MTHILSHLAALREALPSLSPALRAHAQAVIDASWDAEVTHFMSARDAMDESTAVQAALEEARQFEHELHAGGVSS